MKTRVTILIPILSLVFLACGGESRPAGGGTIFNAGDVATTALKVGDCFQDRERASMDVEAIVSVLGLTTVPCGELHDNEVYHEFEVPDLGEWPGDEDLIELAAEGCLAAFEPFVGKEYATARQS